jgi:cytochrome c553
MATGMKAALLLLAALAGLEGCREAPRAAAQAPPQFERVVGSATGRAALVAHGARLGTVLGCNGCHGADLAGHVWSEDPREAILFTSNLTRALPGYSDAQLERTIRFGVRPDGSPLWEMPSQIFTHLSAPDMAALIAWLRTMPPAGRAHPRIVIGPRGRELIASGEIEPAPKIVRDNLRVWPARVDGRHDWARYIVRATCAECHGLTLTGHRGDPAHSPPDLVAAGAYSRAEFRHLMRTGEPTGGRRLGLMGDVARGRFVHFTNREVDAIYDYLRARAEAAR